MKFSCLMASFFLGFFYIWFCGSLGVMVVSDFLEFDLYVWEILWELISLMSTTLSYDFIGSNGSDF